MWLKTLFRKHDSNLGVVKAIQAFGFKWSTGITIINDYAFNFLVSYFPGKGVLG